MPKPRARSKPKRAARRPSIATVRELALELPGTAEKPSYGTPGFRVRDKLFARVLDDDRIVVRMSLDQRDVAVAAERAIFSVTPHYLAHPWVIVALAAVDRARLADILRDAWAMRA
jgi:hypothetical protein